MTQNWASMENKTAIQKLSIALVLRAKSKDYNQFLKLRLSSLVVFSAMIGYLVAAGHALNWAELGRLLLGGFLVVGASNGLNQIIEKNSDRLMTRTHNRPMAAGRMSVTEGLLVSMIAGVIGIAVLSVFNTLTAVLALLSLISYAFVYTPLKKVNSIAVTIGALPGALPVLIGYTAFSGTLTWEILIIFALQFFWQYPHFWSIAWQLNSDYKKAGIKLLPGNGSLNRNTAKIILMFTLALVPMSLLLLINDRFIIWGVVVSIIMGSYLSFFAFKLFKSLDSKDARKLMFASFAYLPIVLIVLLIALK